MHGQATHPTVRTFYPAVISDICDLNWRLIDDVELTRVAWAYYHFSVQFRENLEVARKLYPEDSRLQDLDRGERDTNNLSPWPGVAAPGERMDHDEFMRRTLQLTPIEDRERDRLKVIGSGYLATVRSRDKTSRALSIASYEDGGLEKVFGAILQAPCWDGPLLQAFRHFLIKHIEFDSDPNAGHGALCRHLTPDDRVLPFWIAFQSMLLEAVPRLHRVTKALERSTARRSGIDTRSEEEKATVGERRLGVDRRSGFDRRISSPPSPRPVNR